MNLHPRIALLACALAMTAGAQTTAQDGFEGNLLSSEAPPGVWGYKVEQEPLNFFGTSAAAAKSGSFGLRNVDTTTGPKFVTANGLVLPVASDAGGSQHYERVWFRGSNHNLVSAAKVISMDLAPLGLPAAEVYFEARTLRLKYFNRFMAESTPFIATLDADGQWVLIELFVTGLGTDAGTVALSLDGQLRSFSQGINWGGERLSAFGLGNLFGQSNFTATLDFDDFGASR